MKLTLVIMMLFAFLGNTYCMTTIPKNEKEKGKKEHKKDRRDNSSISSKNFHSIKKWKVTIEYSNGNSISEIIEVQENSEYSPMELAFKEAEKFSKTFKKVKNYNVSPISRNSYVLLAGGN